MTRLTLPLADEMARQLDAAGLGYAREVKWHGTRRWRADFVFMNPRRLIVEVDGGQWVQGTGHNTGTGRERDCEKDAEAAIMGWTTLRFTSNMVRDGKALEFIKRYMEAPSRAKAARSS